MSDTSQAVIVSATEKFQYIPLFGVVGGKCRCGNPDCDREGHAGKHPKNRAWTAKGSTDPQLIKRYAESGNVGILTGAPSNIFVIDIDNRHGGSEALRALEDKHSPLPPTRMVRTGDGVHYYYRHPGYKVTGRNLVPGIDVRGDGNLVVAPPSHHVNGKSYEWVDPSTPIAEAPAWLLQLLTAPTEDVPLDESQPIPEGVRNDTIYRIVCDAFRKGYDKDDVLRLAWEANERRCAPPLPELQIAEMVLRVEKTNRPLLDASKRKSLSWFQFNAAEFLANQAIRNLTDAQVGWKTRLDAVAWMNGGKLEHDIDSLMDFAKPTSKKAFREQWRLALFDYTEVNEGSQRFLINRTMAAHHAEKVQKAIVNQQAGHVGGTAKSQMRRAA